LAHRHRETVSELELVGPTGSPRSIPEPSNWAWHWGSVSSRNRVCGPAWISRKTRTCRTSGSRRPCGGLHLVMS
jgi:hypothetical protein